MLKTLSIPLRSGINASSIFAWFVLFYDSTHLTFFVYEPNYYQRWIKVTICQTESILTLHCFLSQSEFSVLSGNAYIIKLSKICFLCTYNYNNYTTKYLCGRGLMFYSNFSFAIFSLMFFPLFQKLSPTF